jgi:hypothetical protein
MPARSSPGQCCALKQKRQVHRQQRARIDHKLDPSCCCNHPDVLPPAIRCSEDGASAACASRRLAARARSERELGSKPLDLLPPPRRCKPPAPSRVSPPSLLHLRTMASAAHEPAAVAQFSSLEEAQHLNIFRQLPVDARARACLVSRGWNATLSERSLWLRLDLSPASGVVHRQAGHHRLASSAEERNAALLHGAAARAQGQLEALDVSGWPVKRDVLLAVVTANPGLRELRALDFQDWTPRWPEQGDDDTSVHIEALLRAAPQLREFHADVTCSDLAAAARVLRREPPFAPLRIREFTGAHSLFRDADEGSAAAAVVTFAADAAVHSHLAAIFLSAAPLNTAAALDAVVDTALSCQLTTVRLWFCKFSSASASAIARLLGGRTLARLEITWVDMPPMPGAPVQSHMLDEAAVVLLSGVLRGNTTLTALDLSDCGVWKVPAAGCMLLSSLTAHPSLRSLQLTNNSFNYSDPAYPAHRELAGAALGALVAANAPEHSRS